MRFHPGILAAALEGGSDELLSPIFLQTHFTGLGSQSPSNLRTGLSPTIHANGGYIEELEIAVTGAAGSAILMTAETSKVSGLAIDYFEAALNSGDGAQDFFVTVVGNNGTTKITLKEPLARNFTGVLVAKYDAPNGQHLTAGATKAWARMAAEAREEAWGRGAVRGGIFWLRGNTNVGMTPNAALSAYGGVSSASPLVVSGIQNGAAANVIDASSNRPVRPSAFDQVGKQIGCHAAGHGAVYTFDADGVDVVIEFYVGAYRSSTNLNGVASIEVNIEADGVPVAMKVDGRETTSPHTQDNIMRHYTARIAGAAQIKAHWTNLDGAIYYINVSHLTVRETAASGPIFTADSEVIVSLDSWGQFYGDAGDGLFEDYFEALTGATVRKHSVGGMTSEYTLGWLDEWLAAYPNATHCIYGMNVNDTTNLYNLTFNDPDAVSQPLWPFNASAAQTSDLIHDNVAEFVSRCQAAGVRPVILMPAGTASGAQAQTLAGTALNSEPLIPYKIRALATEFTNAHSYINQYGKAAGSRHYDVTNSRWMVADGSAPTSTWTQEGGGTTVTPLDTTAPSFRNSTSRTIPENSAFSMVISTNEPATITITGGADAAQFSLTARDERSVFLTMTAKDYEAPADADANNAYVVQLTATDLSSNATNQTVTVTVTNVAD